MANKILYILTEGDHDSAFIYRILKANGFSTYNAKIKDYPSPLNNFLKFDLLNVSIPEVRIQEARSRFLPIYVMKEGNNIILIYSVGGESKDSIRISLLKALNALNVKDTDAIQALPNSEISVLYFFDADKEGTKKRMDQVINDCKSAFPEIDFEEEYPVATLHEFDDLKIGAYVFREMDKDEGMLEDILIPLMQEDNDDIFSAADIFLKTHSTCNLFKDVLEYTNGTLKKVNGQKYSYNKSLIGTIGQLQKSGKSNTICISDSDYLTDPKIKDNQICNDILEFIKLGIT